MKAEHDHHLQTDLSIFFRDLSCYLNGIFILSFNSSYKTLAKECVGLLIKEIVERRGVLITNFLNYSSRLFEECITHHDNKTLLYRPYQPVI